MATYTGVRIVSAERLRNSANGNPRWHIVFDGPPGAAETEPDASCGCQVENYLGGDAGRPLTVTTSAAGRVKTIEIAQ